MARSLPTVLMAASVLMPAVALADSPVRLTRPVEGATLIPGRTVTIAWEPTGDWLEASEVPIEEWEAFLSVNGGHSYPYRITPHLDADLSTFHFPVPRVISDDVRILIRLGNELREVGFEMPQRFSIAPPGPLLALRQPSVAFADRSSGRGEAARPGERGVRMWVEGTRRGENLRVRTAGDTSSVRGRSLRAGELRLLAFIAPRHQSAWTPQIASGPSGRLLADAEASALPGSALRATSILLLIRRSNS